MSEYSYATLVEKAKEINTAVKKEYKKPNAKWSYYFAKEILNPKKAIPKITIKGPEKSSGDHFSRQIYRNSYDDMAKRLVKYVEKEEQIPNNIKVGTKLMRVSDYTYMFSRILEYYAEHAVYPKYANVNSKAFTKPTEYPNKVYGLWVKYIGTKPKYLDDVCDYILKHFTYQFYYDDKKSNEEVLQTKAGNCTDLLQLLTNMADAMDYDWRVIHTQCRQSGVGHVYGQFKKKGTTQWFTRDIACIADESRYCVWCEVPNGGNLLAYNPSWFIQNRQR